MPGCGTLLAGRKSGYGELVVYSLGLALTLIFGAQFAIWYFTRWPELQQQAQQNGDLYGNLTETWLAVRWALLGITLFLVSWIWSLASSLSILREARRQERGAAPPPIPPVIK